MNALTAPFETFTVGFDKFFEELTKPAKPNYPPYNIVKKDENSYVIEMALAGFSEDDIDIWVSRDNDLFVKGNCEKSEEDNYLHKGIAKRAFKHTFRMANNMEVKSADMVNGVLSVTLQRKDVETESLRKIPINNSSEKQLLQE